MVNISNQLNILNNAIKVIEKKKGKILVKSEENKNIINIVEKFIKKRKLLCYGGTAINNILPIKDQFYNKDVLNSVLNCGTLYMQIYPFPC